VWHGVVAAAAMIALAVTVGWYSLEKYDGPSPRAMKGEPLAMWSAETQEEVARFSGLDEGLSDLEELSADRPWALNGASMYDALEGALDDDQEKATGDTGALMSPSTEHPRSDTLV
jgi:hypothetical protein